MSISDLSFQQALQRRLRGLTPSERALILVDALRLLREALPRLTPPQQRLLTLQIAAALDAAGCHGEAAVLRLSVGSDPPSAQRERRQHGRRWTDRAPRP